MKSCPDCGFTLQFDPGDPDVGLVPVYWCAQCEYEEKAEELYEGEP